MTRKNPPSNASARLVSVPEISPYSEFNAECKVSSLLICSKDVAVLVGSNRVKSLHIREPPVDAPMTQIESS